MAENRARRRNIANDDPATTSMPAGQRGGVPQSASSADIGRLAAIMNGASISEDSEQRLMMSAANFQVTVATSSFLGGCQGLTTRPTQDVNIPASLGIWKQLTTGDFLEVATQGIEDAGAAAQLCLQEMENPEFIMFLKELHRDCVTVFRNRSDLIGEFSPTAAPRRWTAYMFFLAELVHGLGRRSYPASGAATSATTEEMAITRSLASTLCYCGLVVLRAPFLGHPTEVECLWSVLATARDTMRRLAPEAIEILRRRLQRAVQEPNLSNNIRKTLVDILVHCEKV